MRCTKCGESPKETDKIAWKCTSCGKAYGVTLTNIQKLQEKKDAGYKNSLLKCKECGEALDNGNEKIFWKCSCGNVNCGGLGEYNGKKDNDETSNLIKCPDCGKDVSKRAEKCPNCGCPIKVDIDDRQLVKRIKGKKTHLKTVSIILFFVVAAIFITVFWLDYSNKHAGKEPKETVDSQQEEIAQESKDIEDKRILDQAFSQLSDMNEKTEKIGQDVLDNWNTTGTSYVFNGCFDRYGDYYNASQGEIISSHWECIDTVADYKVSVKELLTFVDTVSYSTYKESLENLYSSICSFYNFVIEFPEGMNEITYTNTFNDYRNKCNENLSKAEYNK